MATVLAVVVPLAVVAVAIRSLLGSVGLRASLRERRAWLVVVPSTVLVMALGVPYAYVEWGQDEAPPPLEFAEVDTDASTTTTGVPAGSMAADASVTVTTLPFVPPADGTPAPITGGTTTAPARAPNEIEGTWRVGRGSVVGYRAQEVLVVQDNTAVGRTDDVTGQMTIAGTTMTAAEFTADMTTVTSDQPQRDERYRSIMDTANHPTSRLVITRPIDIGEIPGEAVVITRRASGRLTIRGVTRGVSFDLKARRVQGRIEVLGSVTVRWADYGIPDPGNGVVRVHDHGEMEFLLYFDRA